MKKVLAAAVLALLLVLNLSLVALGAEFQDIYEAYGLKKGDDELFSLFSSNPPEVIVLRPYMVKWYDIDMPINVGTLVIEKGKDANFSFAVKRAEDVGNSKVVTVEITSDITFRYAQNKDPRILLEIAHNTHLKSYAGSKLTRDESSNKVSSAGEWGGKDEGVLDITIPLAKQSGVGNLGQVVFRVEGVQLKKGGLGILKIDTKASDSAGETEQTLPAAIVLGVASVVAAAVGAAAGVSGGSAGASRGSGGNGPEGEDDGGSSYKMYIRKDFGDKIRYDKSALAIYARMGEVKADGTEIDRPDLTEQIEISSGTGVIKVSDQTMAGNYMGALVEAETVKGAQNPTEGIISFKFSGEGGYFQNNVAFKLIGEPYISFPEQGENLEMTVDMLFGDGGVYEVPFDLVDFMEKLVNVKAKPQEGSPFSLELEAVDNYHYIARLTNTSRKPQKIQAKSEIFTISVEAENEVEYAKATFRAVLYPKGISVRVIPYDEDGYALISAYEDTNTEEAGDVTPTRFLVELAVSSVDANGRQKAKLVDADQYKPEFARLKGTEVTTEELVKRFKYEIKEAGKAAFTFRPLMQLPELENPYYVILPISCEYEGETYTLDLPVRLIGEKMNPMAERKEELRLLLQRIRRYMPPEEWHNILAKIKSDLDKRSAQELRLLSKSVIYTAQARLLSDAAAQIDWAETLDWCIGALSVIKWVGDQAFSYLATVYTGPVGDAVLSPMKDMLTALIGEVGASILMGEGFEYENLQLGNSVGTMLENLIMSSVDVNVHEIKQIASVLAGFAVVNVAKHYVLNVDKNGQRSFYNALLAGFGDITANCMKMAGGRFFEKVMKSKAAEATLKTYFGKWIRQYLVKHLPDIDIYFSESMVSIAKFDIVKKYIEELCGFGTVELFSRNKKEIQKNIDKAYKYTTTGITEYGKRLEASNYVITLTLWSDENNPDNSLLVDVDLMKVKDSLFDYIFDSICAIFPFPESKADIPSDPVYIKG